MTPAIRKLENRLNHMEEELQRLAYERDSQVDITSIALMSA